MSEVSKEDILLSVQKYMITKSQAALEYFVSLNPKMDGAEWADCLNILLDGDSHLAITDPTYELMKPTVPIMTLPWIVPVTLTLLYAHRGQPPYTVEVAYWHGFLMGRIEKKGV